MTNTTRTMHLQVSEHYFRLSTECVRLHSNLKKRHSSLNEVIDERAEAIDSMSLRYRASDMIEHLRIIPSSGDTRLNVALSAAKLELIDTARAPLSRAIGAPIEFDQALSLIMFDLVVDAACTEVLTKLGLSADEAHKYRFVLDAKTTCLAAAH